MIVEDKESHLKPTFINVYDNPNVNFMMTVISSMTIPILFEKTNMINLSDNKNKDSKIQSFDGGCFENLPMCMFDSSYKCKTIAPK